MGRNALIYETLVANVQEHCRFVGQTVLRWLVAGVVAAITVVAAVLALCEPPLLAVAYFVGTASTMVAAELSRRDMNASW